MAVSSVPQRDDTISLAWLGHGATATTQPAGGTKLKLDPEGGATLTMELEGEAELPTRSE